MSTVLSRTYLVLTLMFLAGCSTNVSRFQMPGTDMASIRTFLIEAPGDERHAAKLHTLITTQLEKRGYAVTTKTPDQAIKAGEFLLDVAPDWHWDITSYLLDLRVAIYEPHDKTLIAQAHSQQTSLVRKDIDVVVERAIASLFDEPAP